MGLLVTAISAAIYTPVALASDDSVPLPNGNHTPLDIEVAGFDDVHVTGVDQAGIPMVCGSGDVDDLVAQAATPRSTDTIPPGFRGWECVPAVVRAGGTEPFNLEVNTNGPVSEVRMVTPWSFYFVPPAAGNILLLRDDGMGGDRVAGDFVYTIGPFSTHPQANFYSHFGWGSDAANPAGVGTYTLANKIEIVELNSTVTEFLIPPVVGVVNQSVPPTEIRSLSEEVVASAHVINVRSSGRHTQSVMRFNGDITNLTLPIYDVVPDDIDMLTFFSNYKLERTPYNHGANFYAGLHSTVRVNYMGTGAPSFDSTGLYGSSGVLLGINYLDTHNRGIWASNMSHEITHQWSSSLNSSLGLTDGAGHYRPGSSVTSLVGGFQWIANGDGTYQINCDLGRNGVYRAPPLDMYMAGFSDGSDVGTIYVNDTTPICNGLPRTPTNSRTLADIQAIHGVRTPGPGTSQKDFIIAFAVESPGRLLTPTEMTFYEVFADHLTRPVPEGEPDPFVEQGWKSISRMWGPGVTWSTLIPRYGDINADGAVNVDDAPLFVETLLNPTGVNERWPRRADFDGNDIVDGRDIAKFVAALMEE